MFFLLYFEFGRPRNHNQPKIIVILPTRNELDSISKINKTTVIRKTDLRRIQKKKMIIKVVKREVQWQHRGVG